MLFTLLIGIGVLLATVLVFAMAIALILHVRIRLSQSGYTVGGFWKSVAILMGMALVMAAVHLLEIALWALALVLCGEISTFDTAFYCSAENYTALGYGDIILSERWRLLGPMEAINGLLLFGLSTAAMFAVMSRLITKRLALLDHPGQAP